MRREYLIGPDAWQAAEADVARDGELVFGIDLGSGASMSAIAACWAGTRTARNHGRFPFARRTLAERGLRDGVGRLYLNMARYRRPSNPGRERHGYRRTPNKTPSSGSEFLASIVCDRWREKELLDALSMIGAATA